ncbi:MAG TPA: hypothetical protein VKR83_05950 [Ktedonobacteraceae bacterium]|nr:hypothetical protein [Ktedonobacteraceae bacterium]
MIPHKSSRRRESERSDDFALQMLSAAKHDSQGLCHAERSEASLADLWVITRFHYAQGGDKPAPWECGAGQKPRAA